jgi:hypothetical protein
MHREVATVAIPQEKLERKEKNPDPKILRQWIPTGVSHKRIQD